MNKTWNPESVSEPLGTYSQCCAIDASSRLLHIAGQVGVNSNGKLVKGGVEAEAEQALRNIVAILEANEMRREHITKLGIFLLNQKDVVAYRNARQKVMGDIKPPGTLLVVSSLASPDWSVEVEAYAAMPVEN